MIAETIVCPPNSLVLVLDSGSYEIPDSMHGDLVAATTSCVAVGTLAEFDGETRLRLMTKADALTTEASLPSLVAFDGVLTSSGGSVDVASVIGEVLLRIAVRSSQVAVTVLVNDTAEPDDIAILVDEGRL
jgi:hypothetical protein